MNDKLNGYYKMLGSTIKSIIVEDEEGNFVAKINKDGYKLRKNCTIKIQSEMVEIK